MLLRDFGGKNKAKAGENKPSVSDKKVGGFMVQRRRIIWSMKYNTEKNI